MPKSMNADQKKKARAILAKRDGWKCYYCGQKLIPDGEWEKYTTRGFYGGNYSMTPIRGYEFPTLDHIQPLSKGGANDITNLVLCCPKCNHKRGNRQWPITG